MLKDNGLPPLPIIDALADIDPVAQPDGLSLRSIEVVGGEELFEGLLAVGDAGVVLGREGLEVGFLLGLLDGLAGLEDEQEQRGVLDLGRLVVGDVDAALREEVLRAGQRAPERLEGLVDARRRRLRPRFHVRWVQVWVRPRLQPQELAPQRPHVDVEPPPRRRPVRQRLGEELVVRLRHFRLRLRSCHACVCGWLGTLSARAGDERSSCHTRRGMWYASLGS